MKIIIIGGGQIGTYIARLLLQNGSEVRIVENRPKSIEKLLESDLPDEILVQGNGTAPAVLERAGIRSADVAVAVAGADEVNLVAATVCKFEYDVPRVIARVNNPRNAWMFTTVMGVDAAINQADILGHMIADEMNYKSIMTLMRMSQGSYSIVRVRMDYESPFANKPVSEIHLPDNAILIALYHDGALTIPHGDTVIQPGDNILAFAGDEACAKMNELFGPAREI